MLRFLRLVRLAFWRAFQHDAFAIAKASAYSSILTFFPGLLVVGTLMATARISDAYAREVGKPISDAEGNIVTEDGTVLGRHTGVHNYTIGQRKGLGFATGKPVYVLGIDPEKNRIIVGEDDSLRTTSFEIENVNWISIAEPSVPLRAHVKIRHRHDPSPAIIEALPGNSARITFDSPQRAITPGQGAAIYSGDVVLAGGWIK